MEPNQDKWINDILGSIDTLRRTEPSPFLYAKIRNRLGVARQPVYVSPRTVWLAAASFVLLALLNVQLTRQQSPAQPVSSPELNTVVTDMQLYPATTQPYDVWSGQNY